MKNWSLRARIIFTTSLLIGVTLGVILALVSWVAARTAQSAIADARQRSNALLTQTARREVNEVSVLAKLISDQPGTKSVLQADYATISDYLESLASQSKVDWICLVDPGGKVLGMSKNAPANDPIADWQGIKAALDGSTWKGTVARGEKPTIRAAAPIRLGSFVQAAIVVGNNVDNSFLRSLGQSSGLWLSLPSAKERHSGEDVVWTSDISVGTEGEAIKVESSLPMERVVGFLRPLQSALVALSFLALAAAIAVAVSIAYSVTKPLEALVGAAETLRKGLWPKPFATKRGDEIGILQGAFDKMTTDLQANHDRLASMLQIDPLTELLNHRSFRDKLESATASSIATGATLSVALLNIDNFEEFNRSQGAEAADELLRHIAGCVKEAVPSGSFCARNSGDEFIVALVDAEVLPFAEAVSGQIHSQFGVTVSVGCATLSEAIHSHELLPLAAGMAVRQAKVGGKNRIRVLDSLQASSNPDDLKLLLSDASYSAVRALAEAVDAKDEYTRGHSRRVAEYSRDLARACGFDEGFVEMVVMSGTLHDVGKIGIPDSVLKKTDRLTDEEFELVKVHPVLGEKIVGQIPQLVDTLPGIRGHHERYDGAGYPDGLSGENIPLLARILAIADTYDAMTSDRPYRKGLDREVALAAIQKGAGSQFDPDLAAKFVNVFSSHNSKAA